MSQSKEYDDDDSRMPEICKLDTCKKKTPLGCPKCKCGQVFCSAHRSPEDHRCAFDFKQEYMTKLVATNPRVVANKLGDTV
jgi:predicted nucleic acid binding AN1-type Zn finger protein